MSDPIVTSWIDKDGNERWGAAEGPAAKEAEEQQAKATAVDADAAATTAPAGQEPEVTADAAADAPQGDRPQSRSTKR